MPRQLIFPGIRTSNFNPIRGATLRFREIHHTFFFYLGGIFIKLMNSIIFFHCFSKIQSFQICFHMYSPNLVVAFVENKKVSLYNYKYTIFGELREEVNEKIEI